MKKEELKKLLLILIPIIIFIVIITTGFSNVFGSTTDWYNQHIAFADYFRKSFYETGNILPNFSFQLGAGQNIFNFSYYGFLSPYTLLSYLFPFLSIKTFFTIINIVIVLISGVLFYIWFRNHYNKKQSFLATILFTLATPLLFHAHRHFMFMNYIPFVILGLMGVDKYLNKNKIWLISLSIFLITMTSFYYALPSGLCLLLYYVHQKIKAKKKFFNKQDYKFIFSVALGALMASIITFPTLYVILNSRDQANTVDLLSLFLPNFDFSDYTISSYGFGLTSIFLFTLILLCTSKKKETLFLNISFLVLTLFPVFTYVLNGFLYARAKILIPLLPLCFILITEFIELLNTKKIDLMKLFTATLFIIVLILAFNSDSLFIFFLLAETLAIAYYIKEKDEVIFYAALIIIAFFVNIGTNLNDVLLTKDEINTINNHREILNTIEDDSLYRTMLLADTKYNTNYIASSNHLSTTIFSSVYHKDYMNFIRNTSFSAFSDQCNLSFNPTNNILLQTYLGVKYIVSDSEYLPLGYEKIGDNLYQNNNVLPIIYASNNLISYDDYLKLNNKEKMEVLLNYVVVEEGTNQYPETHIEEKELSIKEIIPSDNVKIIETLDTIMIEAHDTGTIDIILDEPIQDEIIFIEFDNLKHKICSEGGLSININGITNLLSCWGYLYYNDNIHFQFPLSFNEPTSELHIELKDGLYEFANISVHSLKQKYLTAENIDTFTKETLSSDQLTGYIDIKQDGYLVINIPYDEGFSIKLNNEEVEYKKVNESFMGIKVTKGYYHVDITYKSPFLDIGIIISTLSILFFAIISYKESRGK